MKIKQQALCLLAFLCAGSAAAQVRPDIKKNPSPFTLLIEDQQQKQWYAVSQLETSIYEWLQLLKGIANAKDDLTVQDGATAMGYENVYGLFSALLPDTSFMKPEAAYFFAQLLQAANEEAFNSEAFDSETADHVWLTELPYSKWGALPITGITFEQAQLFCRWRTYMIEQSINAELMNNDGRLDKYSKDYIITVRLATPAEFDYWLMCERINLLEKEQQTLAMRNIVTQGLHPAIDSVNDKGCALWNYRMDTLCESAKEMRAKHGDTHIPSGVFFPSSLGLYDVLGNVAEMTSVKGVAKGGSYAHYAYQSMPKLEQLYDKPADWLGFRYVVTFERRTE